MHVFNDVADLSWQHIGIREPKVLDNTRRNHRDGREHQHHNSSHIEASLAGTIMSPLCTSWLGIMRLLVFCLVDEALMRHARLPGRSRDF